MPDEPNDSSSESSDQESTAEETQDESLEAQGEAEGDESSEESPEGDEEDLETGTSKAARRFQQLLQERKEILNVAQWYRQNVGTPEDVVAFRRWKAQQAKESGNRTQSQQQQPLTPERREALRKLIGDVYPEVTELQARQEEAQEAMFDSAEDSVRALVKEAGIRANEQQLAKLGRNVMLEIRDDKKLARMWNAGNLECVKIAFNRTKDDLSGMFRSGTNGKLAETRRRTSRLPTPPSGGRPVTAKPHAPRREPGLTPAVHDSAWDKVQASLEE